MCTITHPAAALLSLPTANSALRTLLRGIGSRARSALHIGEVWSLLDSARVGSGGTSMSVDKPLNIETGYPGDVLDVSTHGV